MINADIEQEKFEALAKEVDSHDPGRPTSEPPLAECYPSHPVHTAEEKFSADKKKDPCETKNCSKAYPEVFISLKLIFG